jgi:hypothetical protein
MPLKQLTAARIAKIERIVRDFTRTKEKPGEDLPGLLDREKDANVVNLLKPLEARPRIPVAPAEVVVGIPADLLRRRPDIRRAERQVAAQSARIGIAESDFYPRFSLNGTIGLAAEQFGDLFQTPDSMFGQIGPSFRWDILNYGRILNNVRVQDARFQALAFAYQNTVLQAGREAEDSIVAFVRTQEQRDRLAASVDAAGRTLEITYDQYRLGAVDFTPVVLFESTLAEQQDQLVVSRGSIVLNLIGTYRALGGGWEMRLSREAATDGKHHRRRAAPLPCGEPDDYCRKPYPDLYQPLCPSCSPCGYTEEGGSVPAAGRVSGVAAPAGPPLPTGQPKVSTPAPR